MSLEMFLSEAVSLKIDKTFLDNLKKNTGNLNTAKLLKLLSLYKDGMCYRLKIFYFFIYINEIDVFHLIYVFINKIFQC